jgi:hypothetical protein
MSVELFPSDMPLTSKVAVTILNETVISAAVWYFEYVLDFDSRVIDSSESKFVTKD